MTKVIMDMDKHEYHAQREEKGIVPHFSFKSFLSQFVESGVCVVWSSWCFAFAINNGTICVN